MADNALSRSTNTIGIQTIPIIFIPGVMGSRLQFTESPKTPWDPDDQISTMAFRWLPLDANDKRQILDATKHADVFHLPLNTQFFAININLDEIDRNWGEVVFSKYGPFLHSMDKNRSGTTFGRFKTPVYALGYDWRQTNDKSGDKITDRIIDDILPKERADKAIVITHSMGGLVLRAALNNNADLSGKILGIIHVMQPAAGAPVFYRRCFTGNRIPQDDKGIGILGITLGISPLNIILGNDPDKWATMVSVLRGPTELMPTPNYTSDGTTAKWINFFFGPFLPQSLSVRDADWDPYRQLTHPPGLLAGRDKFPPTVDPDVAKTMDERVENAKAFHDNLGLKFAKDKTWTIFSTGVETDVAFFLDQSDQIDFGQSRHPTGDGTVPASSASILFRGQRFGLSDLCNGDPRQFEVTGVQHADGMLSADKIQVLIKAIIEKMLGLRCFGPAPGPPSQPGDGGTKTFEETIKEIVGETVEEVDKELDKDFNV